MKKTPLTRRTPLKRSQKPLKKQTEWLRRCALKPRSTSKSAWEQRYQDAKVKDDTLQRPVDRPDLLLHRTNRLRLHPHHPFARIGDAILAYVYITKEKHEWCHANSKEAREQGWLQGPYDGRPVNPEAPRPWPEKSEESWPEKYKRKLDNKPAV